MKDRSFFRIMYAYFIVQIAVLCAVAVMTGVTLAESRTERMMNGESVAVSAHSRKDSTDVILTRMLIEDRVKSALCSFPAPIGNTASVIICLEKIFE